MTRTQARTYGVVTPSTRQLLLEAMLRAFAWLVSNVASTLRTILNRITRDWHTTDAGKDQLPTSTDSTIKETDQAETTGLTSGRVSPAPNRETQAASYAHGPQPARNARSANSLALSPFIGMSGVHRGLLRANSA